MCSGTQFTREHVLGRPGALTAGVCRRVQDAAENLNHQTEDMLMQSTEFQKVRVNV